MLKWTISCLKRLRSAMSFAGPSLLDQTIVSGLNFFVGIYLAYALGMKQFGQFSLILVITFFCLEMQRAFVLSPMMTFTAKRGTENYVQSVLVMMGGSALLLAILAALFVKASAVFSPMWGVADLTWPTFFLIVTRTIQEFQRRFLFVRDMPYRAVWIDSTVAVVIAIGLVLLQKAHALNVYNVLVFHGISYAIGYLMGIKTLHTHKTWPDRRGFVQDIRKHWIFGRWLVAGVIATYASSNLLLMTGAAELGSQAAGLVKTAQYLMGGMIVLFQAMENVIPYRMAQVAQETSQELKSFFIRVLAGMMLFCAVHGVAIYLFLDPIVSWIAKGHEAEIRPIAEANIYFTGFLVVTYCLQYLLRALEHTKPIFWANTVTAIFSLVFGPFFIHRFGTIGITYGLFVIQIIVQIICVSSIYSFWFGKK